MAANALDQSVVITEIKDVLMGEILHCKRQFNRRIARRFSYIGEYKRNHGSSGGALFKDILKYGKRDQ